MLGKFLRHLLLVLAVVCGAVPAAHQTAQRQNNNNNNNNNNSSTATTTSTPFPSLRFSSNNNITILHEVHDDRPPLVLNTHEVLPTKPPKKKKPKPYTLLDKSPTPTLTLTSSPIATSTLPLPLSPTLLAEYEKPRPIKPYELHPVTFDFNLGDLEDLEHEALQTKDLDLVEPNALRNNEAGEVGLGLSYTELPEELVPDAVVGDATDVEGAGGHDAMVGVAVVPTSEATTTASNRTSTLATSTTTAAPASSSGPFLDLPTVVTISPHIFKILKTKAKVKGRELLKKEAPLGANSISRYFGVGESDGDGDVGGHGNATAGHADSWQSANLFQLLVNLYDHFFWQPSEIRSRVSTGCGIELQAYLTALNANYGWAQRAYDASGRYRGQVFYGNDKWLGEKRFCYELNRQLRPDERKHFEFEFYVALVSVRMWVPAKVNFTLQLGECLPKTCTSQDVQAILSLDPHAHMLGALGAANSTQIRVRQVRQVPGSFSYWRELRFQVFVSFMLTLVAVIVVATWYQAKLDRGHCAAAAHTLATIGSKAAEGQPHGKAFELYQMSTLGGNNNTIDVEADLNGNGNSNGNGNRNGSTVNGNGTSNNNGVDGAAKEADGGEKSYEGELKMAQMADYKLETCSSAGATGAYEAKQKLGVHQQVLLCFAFQTNANVIMNIDDNKESQTSCVHGLRVFSVMWTILVHTYLQVFTIGENRFQRNITERSIWYQFVGNATFSVDTFFFISGFLVTLLFLKQEKSYPEAGAQFARRSLQDTAVILIYRYIRLTPAYLFVIFFNDFSLRQTFDSSVFQPTVAPDTCSQYWWRNVLYVNNFYPLSEICMIWSWYMANDMQFYVMASILLTLSTRYFKTASLIVCSFLLSSWAVSGIVSLHYNYTHKVSQPFESFDFLYDKPWQRVGTYIMGMIAGYIVYKVKSPPKISTRTNLLLWSGSLALLGIIIFGVWNGQLSVISTAFYVSIGHTAFGLGLVWIVLSCCWGLANPVNRVLSYRGLWPLSRLTYCTYLIHPVIMLLTSYRMEGTVHLNNLFVLTIFLGNAVLSFAVAFFISVAFEAPVIRLLKICFRK